MSDRHVPVSPGMTMQGLGQLVQLYGGAAAATEAEYQRLKAEFEAISRKRSAENSMERRGFFKKQLASIQAGMDAAQERLHKILIGAKTAIDQAESAFEKQLQAGLKGTRSLVKASNQSVGDFKQKLEANRAAYKSDSDTSSISSASSASSVDSNSGSDASSLFMDSSVGSTGSRSISPPRYSFDQKGGFSPFKQSEASKTAAAALKEAKKAASAASKADRAKAGADASKAVGSTLNKLAGSFQKKASKIESDVSSMTSTASSNLKSAGSSIKSVTDKITPIQDAKAFAFSAKEGYREFKEQRAIDKEVKDSQKAHDKNKQAKIKEIQEKIKKREQGLQEIEALITRADKMVLESKSNGYVTCSRKDATEMRQAAQKRIQEYKDELAKLNK